MKYPTTYLLALSMLALVPACTEDAPDLGDGVEALGVAKVTVCHVPPGNPANAHEITVGAPAVRAHLAHGDTIGACTPACVPAPEVCGDGIDNDCNGIVDDGVPEVCGNGVDDDCDGVVDDGCIGDRAWDDADLDGIQGAGEPGLADATFMLRTSDGALVQVAVSDASGHYYFSDVPAGDYYIEANPPAEYNPSQKDALGNTVDELDNDFGWDENGVIVTAPFSYDGGARADLDLGAWHSVGT